MAVYGIGLSRSQKDGTRYDSIRIYPNSTTEALYVKWHTDYADNQQYANVAVAWRGVRRGDVAGGSGYGDWQRSDSDGSQVAWYWRRFPVSELWHSEEGADGPGYWWAAPLSFTSQDASTSAYKDVTAKVFPDGYGFSDRVYDAVQLHVKVRMEYEVDGETMSAPLAEQDLYVGYIPDYHAASATMTKGGLVVKYTSPGWSRHTDTWSLSGDLKVPAGAVAASGTAGELDTYGSLTIPSASIRRDPSGQALSGTVAFNACWRPSTLAFASMSLAGIKVADVRTANTPTISAAANEGGTVTVAVGDSGDKGVPLSSVRVRLVGGEYAAIDQAELAPGESHVFALPPLGVATTWEAVGYGAGDTVSAAATAECEPLASDSRGVLLESMDGQASALLRYDYEESWSGSPECAYVKLAGRKRQSVAYGEGGEATGTLSCTVALVGGLGLDAQGVDDFKALPFTGACLLRRPDGTRLMLGVTSVDISMGEAAWLRSVTVNVTEVS